MESLTQKNKIFQNDARLCASFERTVRQLPLPCILWPTYHYEHFPENFCIPYLERNCVYPIDELERRVHYAEKKLTDSKYIHPNDLHPLLAYMFLNEFHEQLLDYTQENKKDKLQDNSIITSAAPINTYDLARRIRELQKILPVPKKIRRAKTQKELQACVLQELQKLLKKDIHIHKENNILEAEWNLFRSELNIQKKRGYTNRELAESNQELNNALTLERQNTRRLHKELQQVSEQILTAHHLDRKSHLATEYQSLKNDYNLLSRKNDALVSKNIELANQVKRLRNTHTYNLEHLLDMMRERINNLIKRQQNHDHGVLLRSIEREAIPLRRARSYLAKICYNLGILYLNNKEPHRALNELRAARELGLDISESLLEKATAQMER